MKPEKLMTWGQKIELQQTSGAKTEFSSELIKNMARISLILQYIKIGGGKHRQSRHS